MAGLNQDFISQVLPSIQQQHPNLAPNFIPGVTNTGFDPNAIVDMRGVDQAGLPPAGLPPAGPPPPPPPPTPMPQPTMAMQAMAPEAAQPVSLEVPQGPPPTILVRHKGAGERSTMGPKATALNAQSLEERTGGLYESTDLQNKALLGQAMAAQVAYEENMARAMGAEKAMAEHQAREKAANDRVIEASKQAQTVGGITDYWADKSTGQRVGTFIAMAVAGLGQAIAGRGGDPNPVMTMLTQDMDRDLRTKQLNYQARKGAADAKLDAAQKYYDNLTRQFGPQAANQIYSASMKDAAANKAQEQAASSGIQENKARAAQLAGQWKAEATAQRAGAMKTVQGQDMYIDPTLGVETTRGELAGYRMKRNLQDEELQVRALAALKAGKQEGTQKGTQFIAEKMQTAKVPETLEGIDAAIKATQAASDKGVNAAANLAYQNGGVAGRYAYGRVFGKNDVDAQEKWFTAYGQAINALSGQGVSMNEVKTRWEPAFIGANTKESRLQVLAAAKARLEAAKKNLYAGAGPEAAAAYESNLAAQSPPPEVNPSTGITEKR